MDHIASLPDGLVPVRPSDESWELERKEMLRELAGEAFVLVARKDGRVAGYAFVCVEGPDPVWYTGDTHAELAHLSVAEGERGNGVGSALMDAMDAELERRGVEDVEIGVDTGNDMAVRLYEGRGYRPDFRIFYGSPGRKPWACLRREEEDRKAGRGRFAPPGSGRPCDVTAAPGPSSGARSGAPRRLEPLWGARGAPLPRSGACCHVPSRRLVCGAAAYKGSADEGLVRPRGSPRRRRVPHGRRGRGDETRRGARRSGWRPWWSPGERGRPRRPPLRRRRH